MDIEIQDEKHTGRVAAVFGLMMAAAISMRPDRDPLITYTIEASQAHKWSLVVQTDDQDIIDLVKKLLESSAIEVSETLQNSA